MTEELQRVDVTEANEPTGRLLLSDGTVLRFRTVVTDVLRMKGARDSAGNPQYRVAHQTVISVESTAGRKA